MVPTTILQKRIDILQQVLRDHSCDAALIIHKVNLYYLTGTMQNAQFYVPSEGKPILFCKKYYERAVQETPWQVVPIDNYKQIPSLIEKNNGSGQPQCMGLEFDMIPVTMFSYNKNIFPDTRLIDIGRWLLEIRSVKDYYEVELLRKSGAIMNEVFSGVPDLLQVGVSEFTCAAQLENLLRISGHQGLIRSHGFNQEIVYGHLLSGKNGSLASFNDGVTAGKGMGPYYPQGAGDKLLTENEPILLDYVGVFNAYTVDQTRLYTIGQLSETLLDAFHAALEIQNLVISNTRPGIVAGDLYEMAAARAEEAGLGNHFMGFGSSRVKFIGHGVGLELDELPVLAKGMKTILQAGMVFALEPKFVFPDLGVVGIENTWLLHQNGAEKLTPLSDDLVTILK